MSTEPPPIKGGGEPWTWPDGSLVRISKPWPPPEQPDPVEYAPADALSVRVGFAIAIFMVVLVILIFLL